MVANISENRFTLEVYMRCSKYQELIHQCSIFPSCGNQLICSANKLTGFYTKGKLVVNWLILFRKEICHSPEHYQKFLEILLFDQLSENWRKTQLKQLIFGSTCFSCKLFVKYFLWRVCSQIFYCLPIFC